MLLRFHTQIHTQFIWPAEKTVLFHRSQTTPFELPTLLSLPVWPGNNMRSLFGATKEPQETVTEHLTT